MPDFLPGPVVNVQPTVRLIGALLWLHVWGRAAPLGVPTMERPGFCRLCGRFVSREQYDFDATRCLACVCGF